MGGILPSWRRRKWREVLLVVGGVVVLIIVVVVVVVVVVVIIGVVIVVIVVAVVIIVVIEVVVREGICAGVFCIAGNTVEEKLSAPSSLVHQPAEDPPVLPLLRRCTCSVGYAWWDYRGLIYNMLRHE